jgi:hypothetical protein
VAIENTRDQIANGRGKWTGRCSMTDASPNEENGQNTK